MFEISWEVPKYDTRQKVSKCCWKNDADRLAWHRIARTVNLLKKKKAVSGKHKKSNHNERSYAHTWSKRNIGMQGWYNVKKSII